MNRKTLISTLCSAVLLLASGAAPAHPGPGPAGCHLDRRTGGAPYPVQCIQTRYTPDPAAQRSMAGRTRRTGI